MQSYIVRPQFIKKNQMFGKEHSFSVSGYYQLPNTSKQILLIDLLESVGKGEDMEESDFFSFPTTSKYLKTASLTSQNILLDHLSNNTYEYISPSENLKFRKKERIINKYDILYTSTGSNSSIGDCALAPENLKCNFSSHIFKLNIKEHINKFYLFALLKSQYGKDACNLEVPNAGIMRRGGKRFLNIKIPFPTTRNHPHPEQVESLVSLIVQNIIDKEEQIKLKNQQIDTLIEQELASNQKSGTFSYRYPRISEIKEEMRFDTGLYEREFQKIDFLIRNYELGFFNLLSKYNANRGQNLQISNIGESIYSDKKKPNFYRLFTNVELTDSRTISGYRWLGNKNKLNLIPKKTIFLSADGTVGRCIYISDAGNTITNIHPWNINKITDDNKEYDNIFVAMFLGFLYKKSYYEKIKDKANGGGIKLNHLERYIKIPNFPDSKQQEIAQLYYNSLAKNTTLSFDNYLSLEQARNRDIGIFQLNMEFFALREQLETLVHKIVMEEKIEIDFSY